MPRYTKALLQELLDHAYYAHNRAGAISEQNLDPLLVVYENSHRANLPAIALVCALFAYGSVGAIVGFLRKLDFSLLGGDSVLGEQCGSFALCGKGTTTKVANLYHKVQSYTVPTATPRILEEENQAECENAISLESTFEKSHDCGANASLSLRALAQDKARQSTSTKNTKVDSSFETMDSKETSAQPKRYPLFSKEAMDCHATAGAVSRNDDKKVDSSASHNDSSTATILNDSAQDSRICENKAQSITAPQAKMDSSFETMDCHATAGAVSRNDDKKVDSSASHNDSKHCGGAGVALHTFGGRSYLGGNDYPPNVCNQSHCLPKTESPRLENILRATFPYYRFQTSDDVKLLFASLACIIDQGGLESTFAHKATPLAIINALHQAIYLHASRILASPLYAPFFTQDYRARFLASKTFSQGFSFLVGVSPSSPLKRWLMFLRWLVRKDHIDLGLWQDLVSPSDLLLPLDTHTLRVSRALSLLKRKSYDRKAVLEVSIALRRFCPHDPIRYDFALYRLGQSGELATMIARLK